MSKELVRKAVEGRKPERVPIHHAQEKAVSDVVTLGYDHASSFVPEFANQTEWGYAFTTLDDGTMGQVKEPAFSSWEALDTMEVPDPLAPGRFDHVEHALATLGDKYTIGSLGISGFNRMMFVIGLERLFVALYDNPKQVLALADKVFDFECGLIEQWASHGVDAVAFGDDWGTQQGLMIAPDLWREIFKPLYQRQFSLAHELGLHVYLHTCGNVLDIVGDFVEVGVDIFNLNQINLLGIDTLAERFGGRVCFDCPIDHQTTLIRGDYEEINAELQHMIRAFGSQNGRFIAHIEDYPGLQVPKQTTDYVVHLAQQASGYSWG